MGSCGTGLGNFPQPGDPDNGSVILSARTAFRGILVSWTYPVLNPHAVAYVMVYRSLSVDPNTRVQQAVVAGDRYFDEIDDDGETLYYYWIKIVSVNGTIGDAIGPVSATTSPTVGQLLDYLEGQIAESVLAQALRTQIADISNLNGLLLTEQLIRESGDDSITSLLAAMQAVLDEVDVRIIDEVNTRIEDDSALATQINALLVVAGDNAAAIVSEQQARADADSAFASDVLAIQTAVGDNTATILNEQTARVNGDNALASSVSTLQTSVNGHTSSIQTLQSVQSGIAAQYMVKLDNDGYVSGFGQYNDGSSSSFLIHADTFAIGSPDNPTAYPFMLIDGTVYMRNAMIQDAAIDTAKIGDAAITSAKIGNLQVNSLQIAQNAVIVPMGASASANVSVLASVPCDAYTTFLVHGSWILGSGAISHMSLYAQPAGHPKTRQWYTLMWDESSTSIAIKYVPPAGVTSVTFTVDFGTQANPDVLHTGNSAYWCSLAVWSAKR